MPTHATTLYEALAELVKATKTERRALERRQRAMIAARTLGASWTELGEANLTNRDTARTRYEAACRALGVPEDPA